MQTRDLGYKLIGKHTVTYEVSALMGATQVETFITLHNPLPFATSQQGQDLWHDEDPPQQGDTVFVTVVTMDIENEITELRKVMVLD